MSKTSDWVYKTLVVVSWAIFIGLSIEAVGFIVNFIISVYKPGFVNNLYQRLDLTELYKHSSRAFYSTYAFILSIAILKAVLFYLVVLLMSNINMANPFTKGVAQQIERLSHYTLSIGLLSCIAKESPHAFPIKDDDMASLELFWSSGEAFLLMAAVVYVIATIFRKGVELQNESDLII